VLGELELLDHLGAQQAHDVGAHRVAEARVELLGDRCAAEHVPALEHERLAPRLCEVGRAGQAVVAAADNDRVVLVRSGSSHESVSFLRAGS
jgi:hypothetical protein